MPIRALVPPRGRLHFPGRDGDRFVGGGGKESRAGAHTTQTFDA